MFACAEYPEQAERWAPLAKQRWERYLGSAHLVSAGGEATVALERARDAQQQAAGDELVAPRPAAAAAAA